MCPKLVGPIKSTEKPQEYKDRAKSASQDCLSTQSPKPKADQYFKDSGDIIYNKYIIIVIDFFLV